jgi:hypothetical protein
MIVSGKAGFVKQTVPVQGFPDRPPRHPGPPDQTKPTPSPFMEMSDPAPGLSGRSRSETIKADPDNPAPLG